MSSAIVKNSEPPRDSHSQSMLSSSKFTSISATFVVNPQLPVEGCILPSTFTSTSNSHVSQFHIEEYILPIFGKPKKANASKRKPTLSCASKRKLTQANAGQRQPATPAKALPSPSMAVMKIRKNDGEISSSKTKKTKEQVAAAAAAVSAAPTTTSNDDSEPPMVIQFHSLLLPSKFTSNSNFPSTYDVVPQLPAEDLCNIRLSTFTFNSDSPCVTTMGGGINTHQVLVDSGAILYAETSTNTTNIRTEGVLFTGINGVSVSSGVEKLPPMVLNNSRVLKLTEDCAISNIGDRELHTGREPGTIITPKHLNEIGISVYFAGTTVLLQTDTLAISGIVNHQENFSDGLTLIIVLDTVPGKTHEEGYTTPQVVYTKVAFPGGKRTKAQG